MLESSRLAQVEKEMENYKIEVLGLSETRWNGAGEYVTSKGTTLLYSGKAMNEKHESGVGILISKSAKKSLIEWTPISDRIITARFRTQLRKLTLIQCYSPTEQASMEEKENFYDLLEAVINKIKNSDITVLTGDINAKVGSSNTNFEHIMGTHGLGQRNINGELFIEFCSSHELVIGGTLFPHKNIHKATWKSPDNRTYNQIDHIAISKKWKKILLDVRAMRGADVASDHYLIVAQIRLKIKIRTDNRNNIRRVKFDADNLKNEITRRQFEQTLVAMTHRENDARSWATISNAIVKTSEDLIGLKRHNRKEWITEDTWQKIEDRKAIHGRVINAKEASEKEEFQARYREANRNVKRAARRDKRKWAEELAEEAQAASTQGNLRKLYAITKRLGNRNFITEPPIIRSRTGESISDPVEQLNRWQEFYSDSLSANPTVNENTLEQQIHIPTTSISIPTEEPTHPELVKPSIN